MQGTQHEVKHIQTIMDKLRCLKLYFSKHILQDYDNY
jgi:hypothetical protein